MMFLFLFFLSFPFLLVSWTKGSGTEDIFFVQYKETAFSKQKQKI